jgi:predicted acylesterase/phospholipase RssA
MIPKRIYLSGGGVTVIAHMGALKELQKRGYLASVREWVGVSAGALLSLCLVIGYTLEEIEDFYLRFDFTNLVDIDSAPGWIINYGLDTGNKLRKLVEACLHVKGLSETITFEELSNHRGLSFRIFVTDLHRAELVEYSDRLTPNRSVVDAVTASMSLPYYFQPVIDSETGHFLIDGGTMSNYPLYMLTHEELAETLGIYLRTVPSAVEELEIQDLAFRPVQILLSMRARFETRQYMSQTILVELGHKNAIDFGIDNAMKQEMIRMGREATIAFFKKRASTLQRRYSVG